MQASTFLDTGRGLGYTNEAPRESDFSAYQQRVADLNEGLMLDAIKAGTDLPMPFPASVGLGSPRLCPVSEFLGECYGEAREKLFRACHLTAAGQYEAGSKALLEFVAEVARQYGEDLAEVA